MYKGTNHVSSLTDASFIREHHGEHAEERGSRRGAVSFGTWHCGILSEAQSAPLKLLAGGIEPCMPCTAAAYILAYSCMF
jgi:hypothetical protein